LYHHLNSGSEGFRGLEGFGYFGPSYATPCRGKHNGRLDTLVS
jgi:hypothetical protein